MCIFHRRENLTSEVFKSVGHSHEKRVMWGDLLEVAAIIVGVYIEGALLIEWPK
jgi:hypothetical protein